MITVNIYFQQRAIGIFVKLNRAIKIQTGGEPIHLLQIRPQQHLMLPMSNYCYNKITILNMSPVARLANEYYTICNIRDDNAIYVWSKGYEKQIFLQETISSTYTMWVIMK